MAIHDEGGTAVSVIGNDLTGRTSAVAIAGSSLLLFFFFFFF